MKKTIFSQLIKKETKNAKPLEIYDITTNKHELLYQLDSKVVMRISGIYGNYEKVEFTNAYGVKFHKYSKIF